MHISVGNRSNPTKGRKPECIVQGAEAAGQIDQRVDGSIIRHNQPHGPAGSPTIIGGHFSRVRLVATHQRDSMLLSPGTGNRQHAHWWRGCRYDGCSMAMTSEKFTSKCESRCSSIMVGASPEDISEALVHSLQGLVEWHSHPRS